ncbi:MAG: hypothetical protein R3F43_12895 [bacterium]
MWSRIARSGADRALARDRLTRAVEADGDSALIFMKRRRFTDERPADPGFIEASAVQRAARPLLLMPQLITWQRERAVDAAFDAVFGKPGHPQPAAQADLLWVRHRAGALSARRAHQP